MKFYSLQTINNKVNALAAKNDYSSDEFRKWKNEMFKTGSLYFAVYFVFATIFNYIMLP